MTATEVVVDASAMVKLLRDEPDRPAFRAWLAADPPLHAPTLLPYELVNVAMREGLAEEYAALAAVLDRVTLHPGPGNVWPWAGKLTAYDAAYLALATRLAASLVTYDAGVARAAKKAGVDVVTPR